MTKKPKEKERVTVTFDGQSYTRLNEIAVKGDVSISWVIRYAVDNFLKELDNGQHQPPALPLERANGGKRSL